MNFHFDLNTALNSLIVGGIGWIWKLLYGLDVRLTRVETILKVKYENKNPDSD